MLDIFKGVGQDHKQLLTNVLEGLKIGDRNYFNRLSDHEAQYVLEFLRQYSERGATGLYDILWELDYKEKPVSIEQFITDRYYLGTIGTMLYEPWVYELLEVLKDKSRIIEWILSGAIGTGKTTVANVAQSYKLHRLLCLRKPAEYYDLMGDGITTLALGLFNANLTLASSVNYKTFKAIIQTSPWFNERVTHNLKNTWIQFSEDIVIALGSRNTHALGRAVVGGLMDEADFTNSVDYRETQNIYKSLKRRIESRLLKYMYTDPPALLTLISSSVQDDQSFINQRIELAQQYPETMHVSQFAVWDVKPVPEELGVGKFTVFIGDNLHPPRILEDQSEIAEYEIDRLVAVPEIYRQSFEEDIDTSLLDIAGVRTGTRKNLFLRRMDLFQKCMESRETLDPFTKQTLEITIDDPTPISSYFRIDKLFRQYREKKNKYGLIYNPHIPRFLHVDLSKNGDACGISVGHCPGFVEKIIQVEETKSLRKYYIPKFYNDFSIRITAKPGTEIDFEKIRDFVFFLHTNGMRFGGISYDSWQSIDSLQYYKKSKVCPNTITLSVDRTGEAYGILRSAIIELRFSTYPHLYLTKEIKELLRNPDTKKCDHPAKGSKDVSDSVAGWIAHCMQYYKPYYETPNIPVGSTVDISDRRPEQLIDRDFHIRRTTKRKLNI